MHPISLSLEQKNQVADLEKDMSLLDAEEAKYKGNLSKSWLTSILIPFPL